MFLKCGPVLSSRQAAARAFTSQTDGLFYCVKLYIINSLRFPMMMSQLAASVRLISFLLLSTSPSLDIQKENYLS